MRRALRGLCLAVSLFWTGVASAEEIAVSWYGVSTGGMPWAIAMEKGYFEAEGVNITKIISGQGGGTDIRTMIAGGLPYAESSAASVWQANQAGADLRIIASNVNTVSEVSWVALKDSQIKGPSDLKGKKIGFTNPGSTTQAMGFLLLKKGGLTPEDVTFLGTGGFSGGLTALESGQLDVMPYPQPQLATLDPKFRVVIAASDVMPPINNVVGVASKKDIETRPELLRGIIAARAKAVQFINEHPSEAAAIIAPIWQSDQAVVEKVLRSLIEDGSVGDIPYWGPGTIHIRGIENAFEALRSIGVIKEDIDVERLIDWSVLPKDIKAKY